MTIALHYSLPLYEEGYEKCHESSLNTSINHLGG